MSKVEHESADAGTGVKAGEHDFVNRDCGQTHERDAQGVVMENRYAKQRQPEQHKIDRNTQHRRRTRHYCNCIQVNVQPPTLNV